jgi:hypothetical protein
MTLALMGVGLFFGLAVRWYGVLVPLAVGLEIALQRFYNKPPPQSFNANLQPLIFPIVIGMVAAFTGASFKTLLVMLRGDPGAASRQAGPQMSAGLPGSPTGLQNQRIPGPRRRRSRLFLGERVATRAILRGLVSGVGAPPSSERHYSAPPEVAWLNRGAVVALAGCTAWAAYSPGLGKLTAPMAEVLGAVTLLLWLAVERVRRQLGLYETRATLIAVTLGRTVTCRWDDIERFAQSQFPTSEVLIVATDGSVISLRGATAQGSRIVWSGGDTRDIIGVLNQRLAERRAAPRPAPGFQTRAPASRMS